MYFLTYNSLFLLTTIVSLTHPLSKLLFSTLHYFHRLLSTPYPITEKSPFLIYTQDNFNTPSTTNHPLYTLIGHPLPLPVYNYPLNKHSLSNNPSTRTLVIIILLKMTGMFYILIFLILIYLISSFIQTKFLIVHNSILVLSVITYVASPILTNSIFYLIIKSKCNYITILPTVAFHVFQCLSDNEFFFYHFLYLFKRVHIKRHKSNWCFYIKLGNAKQRQRRHQHRFQPYSEGRILFNFKVISGFSVDFSPTILIVILFDCSPIFKFLRIMQIEFNFLIDLQLHCLTYNLILDSGNAYISLHFCVNINLLTLSIVRTKTAPFALCTPTFSFKQFNQMLFFLPILILYLTLHIILISLKSFKPAIPLNFIFFYNE